MDISKEELNTLIKAALYDIIAANGRKKSIDFSLGNFYTVRLIMNTFRRYNNEKVFELCISVFDGNEGIMVCPKAGSSWEELEDILKDEQIVADISGYINSLVKDI